MPFFEIGEIILLDQKIIKLNFKKRRLKEMEMSTIMVGKSFQKKSERFIRHNVSSPIMDEGYELFPAGYISFLSFDDYKKIKKN